MQVFIRRAIWTVGLSMLGGPLYGQIAEEERVCQYEVRRGFWGDLLVAGSDPQAICERAWAEQIVALNINVNLYGGYPDVVGEAETSACWAHWPVGLHHYLWIHKNCSDVPPDPPDLEPQVCGRQDGEATPNPMFPATGEKLLVETDIRTSGPHPLTFRRIFRSLRVQAGSPNMVTFGASKMPHLSVSSGGGSGGSTSGGAVMLAKNDPVGFQERVRPPMGQGWTSNWHGHVSVGRQTGQGEFDPTFAALNLGTGVYRAFEQNADGSWRAKGGHRDRLWVEHSGAGFSVQSKIFYRAVDSDETLVFHFNEESFRRLNDAVLWAGEDDEPVINAGLSEIRSPNGWRYRITASDAFGGIGMPQEVVNQFGERLVFSYLDGQVSSIAHYSGSSLVESVAYGYDGGHRLQTISYPDGTIKQYHYENEDRPNALTGYSLAGVRKAIYAYDTQGRASETWKANSLEHYRVTYPSGMDRQTGIYGSSTIFDPLNTSRSYWYKKSGNRLNVIGASHVGHDEQATYARSRGVNESGFLTSENSFVGYSTRWSRDADRQLPVQISEGGGLRQQSIQWHPTFRLPTQIDETGGRRTVNTYDSRGNLTERTVTATSGTPTSQTWRWSYNAAGLVATETDPAGATTAHTYNSAGRPTRSVDPLGHVTTYGYDNAGRLARISQADGLVRLFAYTPRGWVSESSRQAGGLALTTRYTYTAWGDLSRVSLPSGHVIDYRYDAAERLTGWSDNRGQRGDFTLDAMGNRTQELVRNHGGQVAYEMRRVINSLNRVDSETVGTGLTTHYSYNADGKRTSRRDAASNATTQTLDALDRVTAITDPMGRTARLTYSPQDAVTQASDFKSVTTYYTRDVQGNAHSETTADAGSAQTTYDVRGLPAQVTDAIGRATAITRDALGRPTRIAHSASGSQTLVTVLRYDLEGEACNAAGHPNASRGRLCEMTDYVDGVQHVFTRYQWDSFGRLTGQAQQISSSIADHSEIRTVAYGYVPAGAGAGELAAITYPSGSVLVHQYSASGQLTGLLWNGAPLVQDIVYNALQQPLSWTWTFAGSPGSVPQVASRSYDTAGQLRTTEFATYTPDNTGRIVGVTQNLLHSNGGAGWVEETVPFTVQYDATGRVTGLTANGSSPDFRRAHTYAYGPNGNRTRDTVSLAGQSAVTYSHTVAGNSNRQTAFGSVNVVTNTAGDITSLLGRSLSYDSAGRLREATHTPACPSGNNCKGPQTTTSRYNGQGQRYLRETTGSQTIWLYGQDGYSVLSQTRQHLGEGALPVQEEAEQIWLPTGNGPMPLVVMMDGTLLVVHADHLNTPRRLTDGAGRVRWQWAYSAFGEVAPQSIPAPGQAAVNYSLRYPGQVDDDNGLFYNWNRFYDARTGRYTQADPIGLDGGWSRFGYVGGNPLSYADPYGLNPVSGALAGAGAGSVFGPVGTVVGGIGGAVVGGWIGWNVVGPMWAKPPENAYDPNGPKAPGKPGEAEGFKDPKGGENWVPNPNPGKGGSSWGWQDAKGDVWCPSGQGGRSHGGPHWDVQTPGGDYRNVKPKR
ncbi:MAG: RHS repeat-associated core domain-containing protein [Burkholderiaceae bacterium]